MNLIGKKNTFTYTKLFGSLFMAGFLLGILYTNFIGKEYLQSNGIFSNYYLTRYQYMDVVSSELFWYILEKRILPMFLIWILGITLIGGAIVYGTLIWYGFSAGLLVSMGVMKFGFQGIFLCMGGVFPQYIVYVPLWFLFLHKVYSMYRTFYLKKEGDTYQLSKKQMIIQYALSFLVIAAFAFIGIMLESYVNPYFFKLILKKV